MLWRRFVARHKQQAPLQSQKTLYRLFKESHQQRVEKPQQRLQHLTVPRQPWLSPLLPKQNRLQRRNQPQSVRQMPHRLWLNLPHLKDNNEKEISRDVVSSIG
jgi:hypothetical protein